MPLIKATVEFPGLAERHQPYIEKLKRKFRGAYYTFLWEDICKSDDISHYAGGTPETVDMFMQRLLAVAKKEFEVAQQCVKRKYHMMLGKANISTLFEEDSSATSHMENVSDEYLNGIYSSYPSKQYGAGEGNRPKPIKDRHTKSLCQGCGHYHSDKIKCGYRNHPDFNREEKPLLENNGLINMV